MVALSVVSTAASLAALTVLAFADVFTYSAPDTFLGLALAAQGAGTGQVMLAYGVAGAAAAVNGILVLLGQSHPYIVSLKMGSKWLLMLLAQGVSTLAAAAMAAWPTFTVITGARAAHGAAAVVSMIYCLVLLIEVSPQGKLGFGIALLTAGMTAGDAIAPVLGAVVYDKGGLRAVFCLTAAVNLLAFVAVSLPVVLAKHDDGAAAVAELVVSRAASFSASLQAAAQFISSHSGNRFTAALRYQSASGWPDPPGAGAALNLTGILSTLRDPVIFSQCFFLLLEQMLRCALTVILPAIMATTAWVVGVIYIANVSDKLMQVVGAITAPFALNVLLARRPNTSTHALSACLSVIMGATTALCVMASQCVPALCILLFLYGASQAAVEALLYIHVAKRVEDFGSTRLGAAPVSMCMFYLAQTGGGGLGSLTGGGLQHQSFAVLLGMMGAGAGVTALYGSVLGFVNSKKPRKNTQPILDNVCINSQLNCQS
eukprot:gene8063-8258_t